MNRKKKVDPKDERLLFGGGLRGGERLWLLLPLAIATLFALWQARGC